MEKTIEIQGMSCSHCEMHVKKELEAIPAVETADVSAADKKAVVTLSKKVDNIELQNAVEEAGYKFIRVSE